MASPHGRMLLHALLNDPKGTAKFVSMGLHEALFQGTEIDLFESVNSHVEKYGRLPHPKTIGVEILADLDVAEFYLDHTRRRYEHRQIVRSMKQAQECLQGKDPVGALDALREAVVELTMRSERAHMVDFSTEAGGLLDAEYKILTQQLDIDLPGVATGYPTIDKMGRLREGDVLALVGRPQQGKTYQLLNMAHNAWHTQKKRVMFLSMEMRPLPLIQRITAMHEHMSVTLLRRAEYPKDRHKKLLQSLAKLEADHDRFWIVDGNLAATIDDVHALVHQTQPDVLYVDGGYLLQARDKRIPRYERVNQTLEFLKQEIATNLGVPVFVSYQFNKKGKDDKDLENIGGSDSIGQLASIVLALWEKEENEAEFATTKKVDIIKGRNGEQGQFTIHWTFDKPPFMNFSEVADDESHNEQMDVYV